MKEQQTRDLLAPRPVHPTAIRHHGLFGSTYVNQHMVIDERWSTGALIDEFHGMANLLSKRLLFKNLENKAYRKQLHKTARNLRTQCRNGRTKLQNILHGNNVLAIRNYLINHKDMQRLYQKMPVSLVVDNINQRTFVMRKERDRLEHRLQKLKHDYEVKLVERANIENRIKYENEFVLEEEIKLREFQKKVENSNIRLKANKTINATYRKVIQVLRHDGIFYEPILRSLSKDIDDQSNFIKHILYLGIPAIAQFKKLNEEYRLLEEKSRKSAQQKIQTVAGFKKIAPKQVQAKTSKAADLVVNVSKRYTRETKSMLKLKNQLEDIESVIKQIKMATLCSKAREIFPRFQSQVESNFKLIKQNDIGQIHHEFLTFKEKLAAEQESVLLHNYSEQEEKRLLYIKSLEEKIKSEDVKEEETLAHIKTRADVFVILRYTLWNLSDILRYVDRPPKVYSIKYPNTYLKLPLLKFEMLTMRACAPELFEEDTKLILTLVEKKLRTLMKGFSELTAPRKPNAPPLQTLQELWEEYHVNFLTSKETDEQQEDMDQKPLLPEDDLFEDSKTVHNVPNRKQIKLQSAKIVDELSKKED
ncbi:uncharacterized protein LOC111681180 [Lucilia cuprina]|uniref:uncharacterized protein LOC111681180 n=1 Tax=Lucilia cuprina TaxID=7375 RepID=UPI001F057BFB|nr:uncharacterized protein LOC111681180 [Lucilia cuprina]